MPNPNLDPRLLPSVTDAKGKDVEARLIQHIAGHGPAAPGLAYQQVTTVINQTVSGTYTWVVPAGVTTAKIECVGAGAGGGGGGSSHGGEGGGGGEYACELAYPVVPGQTYNYTVGNGGTGGTTGYNGEDGTDSIFDTDGFGLSYGVFANGGTGGSALLGGAGGGQGIDTASPNSIVFPGGNGGGTGSQSTGGCGGGESGGSTAAGGNGATSGSSTGAAGGSSGPGANGGAGGNAAASGVAGNAGGGGGGGAGYTTGTTQGQSSYRLVNSASYFGSDAIGGNSNQFFSDAGGTMWQSGPGSGTYVGTMKSLGIIGGTPTTDLSGKTIDKVTIRLKWTSTYGTTGSYVVFGYSSRTSTPLSWDGTGTTAVKTWWQTKAQGAHATDVTGTSFGAALASGSARSISLGRNISSGFPQGDLFNYGSVYGAGGDNAQNPLITVNWHTGAAPVAGGAGGDGRVVITYATQGPLQSAMQPAAGSAPSGDAFAAGYTGPVTAMQPGTSPAVAETWHSLGTLSGYTVSMGRYRLTPTGDVELDIAVISGGANASSVAFSVTLPVGYRLGNGLSSTAYPLTTNTPATMTAAGGPPRITTGSGGGVNIAAPANTSATYWGQCFIPTS